MKYTFKQFNAYAALSEAERTDDKFAEIFGLESLDEGVVDDIAQAVGGAAAKVAKAVGYQSPADKARAKIADATAKRAEAKKKMDAKLAKIKSFDNKAKELRAKMDTADAAIAKDRAQLMRKSVGKYTDSSFAKDLLAQQNEEAIAILQSIVDGDIELSEAAKAKPVYSLIKVSKDNREYKMRGTLEELIKMNAYTLERGASYQGEKGTKKINQEPKNIKALVDNLTKAVDNAAANGYSGITFKFEEIKPEVVKESVEVSDISIADILNDLRLEVIEQFGLTEDQTNTIEGLMVEEIEQFLFEAVKTVSGSDIEPAFMLDLPLNLADMEADKSATTLVKHYKFGNKIGVKVLRTYQDDDDEEIADIRIYAASKEDLESFAKKALYKNFEKFIKPFKLTAKINDKGIDEISNATKFSK